MNDANRKRKAEEFRQSWQERIADLDEKRKQLSAEQLEEQHQRALQNTDLGQLLSSLVSATEAVKSFADTGTGMRLVDDVFTERHDSEDVEGLLQRFHNWDNNQRERTKDDYLNSVSEFSRWFAPKHPAAADRRDIILYMDYLKHRRPRTLSESRRKSQLAALRSFFQFLMYEDESRSYDPTYGVVRPKVVVEMGEVLTGDELQAILAEPSGTARDRIQAWLLTYTAARSSEIRNLRWKDIQPEEKLIHLNGKGSKHRVIDIHPALWPELKKW